MTTITTQPDFIPLSMINALAYCPRRFGYEFIQALRADPSFDSMRVMMVTTEADMGNVTKALEAGANEYLMKPFTKEAVSEKLSMLGIES